MRTTAFEGSRFAAFANEFALLMLATAILGACEGSEVRRPLNTDGFVTDADGDDVDGDGVDGDEVDGDDTPDGDGDVTPLEPTVEFWFVGRNGELGRGVAEVTLLAGDEQEDDLASAGFQTEVTVATFGVAAGEEVRFFVGDFTQGTAVVSVDSDGVGSATFPELTLPETGSTVVRIEAVDGEGQDLLATKAVTVDAGACVITASLRVDDNACVVLDPNAVVAPFEAATIEVQRVTGPCQRVGGTARLGATSVTLAQTAFREDGSAALLIPIDPGTTFVGDISFELVATHPDDIAQNGTASGAARFDQIAPRVAWVTPAAAVVALSLADDADGDSDNGIQVEVRVNLTLAVDETATAALFLADEQVGEVVATGPGAVTFGQITFASDGTATLRVEVTDRCGNEVIAERVLDVVATPNTIAILTPDDGAVLLASGDGDAATATIYDTSFAVSANAAAVGTQIEVLCQAATDLDPDNWTLVGTFAVTTVAGDATYAVPVAVDVDIVAQAARCIARMAEPSALVSEAVRVTFAIPAPTIVIAQPVDGTCFTSATMGFSGTATELDGRTLGLTGVSPGPADGPIDLPDFAVVGTGAAAGDWSATYPAGDVDGLYRFTLSGEDRFGNPVVVPANGASISLTVDRVLPTLAITAPVGPIDGTTTPDADAATPGYQTLVVIAVTEATTLADGEVCLAVNGAAPVCQGMGNAVAFLGVTLAAGDNLLVVTGKDGCGNVGQTVSQTVSLTLDNPIAIVAPADGANLLAAGDTVSSTATTYDMAVTVDADGAAVGAMIDVACRTSGGTTFTSVGSTTVATIAINGVYTVGVAVDTVALGTSVECRATVDLPNPGVSEVVSYVLALPAPTLALTAPVANACFRADIGAAGTSTALEGRLVTASLVQLDGAVVVSNTATADAGAWATTLALGVTPDGAYGVIASATDSFGNPAAIGTAVSVVVDRTAPVLALTAPVAPDIVEADDTSTAAGIQVNVVASYADARSGGQVCLAVGTAVAVCKAATASVAFADVTLQPGDNTLTLSGTDACGNPAANVVVTRRLQLDAPAVKITTPASDLTTAATKINLVVTVTDSDDVPLAGLTVVLLNGGVLTGITPVGAADGTYAFADVPLTAGAVNTFTAEAPRPNSPTGVSGPRLVTQKNVLPTIAITSPTPGTLFIVASVACQVGQPNCVTTVTATTANAEDGSAATLSVACGGAPVVYNASVTTNAVSFANVVLTNQQTCTLTPGVTDVVAQVATGTVVTVSVDRTTPTVLITSPKPILQSADDAAPGTAGLQYALSATLGGVAAGATVTAVISWNDGAPQSKTLTHTVATTTADGGSYVATFDEIATPGFVTWPNGTVSLVVRVSDVNGNPTSANLTVQVDTASSVRITGPAIVPADTCGVCAAGTVCQGGACWIAWGTGNSRQLVVIATGLQTTTNNLRVCSDAPSLAGSGAAACSSTASATGPYRQVLLTNGNNGTVALDLGAVLPDGEQRLVAEILPITGGAWISSQGAAAAGDQLRRVFVDLDTPAITAITSPSDDAPLGTLNAAEQEALPRAFDIAFTSDQAARAEVYVNGTIVTALDVNVGLTIVRVTLPEGTPEVWVVLSDAVNNRSPATPGLGAVTYRPLVDVTAPTLAFTRPTKSPLKLGDILDVILTSNAEGNTVTLFDGATQVATGAVTSGSVTFSDATFDILTDGSHTLTASVTDAAGNATPASTTPTVVVVDTLPPSGDITSPASPWAPPDAAAGTPGFQVAVTFTTANGATTWSLSSSKGCDPSFQGCQTPVVEATGSVTSPGGAEPPLLVTVDTDAPETWQKIILTTYDDALNAHTTEVSILITVGCAISFGNLPQSGWYNATACGTPGCTTTTVDIQVSLVGLCGAQVDSLVLSDGTTEYTTPVPPSDHTFTISIDDGDNLSLQAKALDGLSVLAATAIVPIKVDLVPPQVAFISTTLGSGFVTPAEGESVLWGYLDDLATGTAGMQFSAAVQVTDTNANGGSITALTATSTAGTVALAPSNGNIPLALSGASPISQLLLGLTLADNLVHTVTITATDAAGNSDTSSFSATVDVTRPGIVSITSLTVDPRRPRFPIAWTAVGDDGANGAAAFSYEVRYSSLPIVTEGDWDGACEGNLPFGSDPMPAPAAPGQPMTVAVGGPDGRPADDEGCKLEVRFDDGEPPADVGLYVAVRAFDEVGNGSELTDASRRAISNAELWNEVSRVKFDNPGSIFGSSANALLLTRRGNIIGDITGDGRAEWVVGSPNTNGFCVFAGRASLPDDETIDTLSGTNHTCLMGASNPAFFAGVTISQVGHLVLPLGDVNSDGLGDFGVAGRISTGSTGGAGEAFVVIYLGRAGVLPNLSAPDVRIRGIRSNGGGNEYVGFCSAGDFDGLQTADDGDADTNPETTDDLAIGEPFASVVHVIPGRTTWTTASVQTFDLAQAGVLTTLGAWSVATTPAGWGPTATSPSFGLRCAPAGDILATPTGLGTGAKDDLLVFQSGSNDSRVFLFPGREFATATAVTVTESPPAPTLPIDNEDERSLRLRQELSGLVAGFGSSLQGDVDFTGDGVPDVLVGHVGRRTGTGRDGKAIYLFDGAKLQALVGGDVRVAIVGAITNLSYAGTNGWVVQASLSTATPYPIRLIGNFDRWAPGTPAHQTPDLLIGNEAGTSAFLMLNQIDTGTAPFPVLDGDLVNLYRPSGTSFSVGIWNDGGADLNGDGVSDIITGTNLGEILIVH